MATQRCSDTSAAGTAASNADFKLGDVLLSGDNDTGASKKCDGSAFGSGDVLLSGGNWGGESKKGTGMGSLVEAGDTARSGCG
jgi:hypothetical protein